MNFVQKISKEKCVLWTTILFVVVITLLAWQSDDAYHAYVMAKHLVEGNGFVYNIGERATASTCPLFTLVIALGYFVFRNMYLVSLLICILFSSSAYFVVVKNFCKTTVQVIATFLSFALSHCFISFTTAGLENCMLFFWAALFLKIYVGKEKYNARDLFKLAILLSLIAMTRMDMVLAFVPAIVFGYLFRRESCSFIKAALIGLAGLMPFILWELFATFYYGFPFPNTAYVKLGASMPLLDYIIRGQDYFFATLLFDPIVVLVPIISIFLVAIKKDIKMIACSLGTLLYIAYLFYIGGDFMVGRLYTVIFFISIIVFLWFVNSINNKKRFAAGWLSFAVGCFVLSILIRPVTVSLFYPNGPTADERSYYFVRTSLINNTRAYLKTGELLIWETWSEEKDLYKLREAGDDERYLVDMASGIVVYEYSGHYMVDRYALGDPFLSKLPAIYTPDWRVGHFYRDVPIGYKNTVKYDQNMIQNKSLSEYYEKIKLITRGPLFSKDRIKAIIDINTGKYDYLIDDYVSTLDENNAQILVSNNI